MPNIRYAVISPGGNTTAIVTDPVPRSEHVSRARSIMETHREIEQVGFIEPATIDGAAFRLQMMGGEFCGNATRAAALWWSLQQKRNSFAVEVSGFPQLVEAEIKDEYVRLSLPAAFVQSARQIPEGAIVDLMGIRHIITSDESLKGREKEIIAQYAENLPAVGVMHITPTATGAQLEPIVWVRETDTLIPETGCASGSIATAVHLGHEQPCDIRQPSGADYQVQITPTGITIGGNVKMISQSELTV